MIRTCRPDDLAVLQDITVVCFEGVSIDHNIERKLGHIANMDWKTRKAAHIADDLAANPEGIFVYEEAGTVVGFITTRTDPLSRVGHIPNLSVLPEFRGRGFAHRLMLAALDYLRDQGMAAARIETLEQNNIGQVFYPSVGFEEVARQIHYAMRLDQQ